MAIVLVVHNPFVVNGNAYGPGDLVSPSDVPTVQANPLLIRYCTWAEHADVA
jgi:hypothetical protein